MIAVPRESSANLRWRKNALWDGAKVPGAAKALREQCAEDILFWVNTFCFTFDPRLERQKVVPFTTYPFQDDALLKLVEAIRKGYDVGIEKSRDMGASWINLAALTWLWQFSPMNNFLVVSRNESYVDGPSNPKSLFWKIDFLLDHQPKWLKPEGVKRTSMHIGNLENGSVIDGESTTGEVGRGDRRTAILLDEFAAFSVADGYNAQAATQSATNCRIYNSTPKGRANAFYEVIANGKKNGSAEIITMHWSAHPEKNKGLYTSERDPATGRLKVKLLDDWKGFVEIKRQKVLYPDNYPFVLDEKVHSPWYDRECDRSPSKMLIAQELDIDWAGSDYAFFDSAAVEKYCSEFCREPDVIGDLVFTPETCTAQKFEPNLKGRWRLWIPVSSKGELARDRRFVLGADVAAGTGASNSTIAVYERGTNEKVAEYANPNILPDEFGRVVVSAARFFNNAKVIPDASGPTGKVCLMRILTEGYTNIYIGADKTKLDGRDMGKWGVYLNPAKRTEVLHGYRDAIANRTIINRSSEALKECGEFICTMQGFIEHSGAARATDPSGAAANHGDRVIADALCALELSDDTSHEEAEEPEIPKDTLAWRMRQAKLEAAERLAAENDENGWPDEKPDYDGREDW